MPPLLYLQSLFFVLSAHPSAAAQLLAQCNDLEAEAVTGTEEGAEKARNPCKNEIIARDLWRKRLRLCLPQLIEFTALQPFGEAQGCIVSLNLAPVLVEYYK